MKLLIVARMPHYRRDGRWHALGPYAREIDIWADLFPEVVIAGSVSDEPMPADCVPFSRPNISVVPVSDGTGRWAQLVRLPVMIAQLGRYLWRADAAHVRCPCDLGLLGVVLAPLFCRRRYAKYAAQWPGFPGEALAWRWQRAILRSRWWNAPVTVYGEWPNQPAHVVPFFTSVMTEEQVSRARVASAGKKLGKVPRVLFVGRLTKSKNVDVLLDALAGVTGVEAVIVGDGPERAALEEQAERLKLGSRVRFVGGVAFEQVLDFYEQADVLVLASNSEGWPKALAEGMAFGLVCIGSDRGLIPTMLSGGRGLVVPPGDVPALTAALQKIVANRADSEAMGQRAAAWSQQHSLEGLREALRKLLEERWA
ncbi:MAG: D-inositol-3-phosphate glycosyltransferase [Verrucomicrobiae bacterium]|nr:D-inositol-3-phosphate glycosyltransferase [Verrucomicrobiae bacterium]